MGALQVPPSASPAQPLAHSAGLPPGDARDGGNGEASIPLLLIGMCTCAGGLVNQ